MMKLRGWLLFLLVFLFTLAIMPNRMMAFDMGDKDTTHARTNTNPPDDSVPPDVPDGDVKKMELPENGGSLGRRGA